MVVVFREKMEHISDIQMIWHNIKNGVGFWNTPYDNRWLDKLCHLLRHKRDIFRILKHNWSEWRRKRSKV